MHIENKAGLYRSLPFRDPRRRQVAVDLGFDVYFDQCPKHPIDNYDEDQDGCLGFYTETGECPMCVLIEQFAIIAASQRAAATTAPPYRPNDYWRREAIGQGLKEFVGECRVCGPSVFNTRRAKCLVCYDAQGYPRRPSTDGPPAETAPRARARHLGHSSFMAVCEHHGAVPHSVRHGRCLVCHTAEGFTRRDVRGGPHPRTLARKAGSKTYRGHCAKHGDTDFSTVYGACCKCRGIGRIGRPRSDAPRAVARREGRATYLDTCNVHGGGHHSVLHGRCLGCYTSAGLLRSPGRM